MQSQNNDDATNSLATVHYRGGQDEFQFGMKLLVSTDPRERAVGADVLAQLGWQDRTFLDESVDALVGALRDPDGSGLELIEIPLLPLDDPHWENYTESSYFRFDHRQPVT